MRLNSIIILSAASVCVGVITPIAIADPVEYQVTVNTTSIATQYGYIDMQFNPSTLPDQQSATATVSDFVTDGVYNPDPSDSYSGPNGDVTVSSGFPTTPGSTVQFVNDQTTNELTEDMTFGTTITFDLTLDGPMIESPTGAGGGTTFYLDFINSAQDGYLLTNDPSGSTPAGFFVGYVTINPDGTTKVTENPDQNGLYDAVFTLIPPVTTEVPEPSALVLMAAGLGLVVLARLRAVRQNS